MARGDQPTRLRSALAVAPITAICITLTLAAAYTVDSRSQKAGDHEFDKESVVLADSIERQIERHVVAVEDTAAFAEATWPGDIHEWRSYITQRINDSYLAFSSSAGLIERVPAEDLDAFEAREVASSGEPFEVVVGTPPDNGTDLLVLSRTAIDMTSTGIPIRGLDTARAIEEFGLTVPGTDDPLVVLSLDDAPGVVSEVLGITARDIGDVPIAGTDVLFVRALGPEGSEPLGWVVAPAQLGHLLTSAISDTTGNVNATVSVPELGFEGDLGRYEALPGLAIEDASHVVHRDYEMGGWTWKIDIWANDSYGSGTVTTDTSEVLLFGLISTLAFTALLYGRRRHRSRLGLTEVELSKQRTMTETDALTGLLNRHGLSSRYDRVASTGGTTVLFLDLDEFKLVNDGHGHAAGDETLVAVADAIRSAARDDDLIARLGGDEFIVVCPGVGDPRVARQIADRFTSSVALMNALEPLSVSIGVAVSGPAQECDLQTLVHLADKSMYEAKRSGGARAVLAKPTGPVEPQPA